MRFLLATRLYTPQQEFRIRNLLFARRYGLPGCKRYAQQELEKLGIFVKVRGGGDK